MSKKPPIDAARSTGAPTLYTEATEKVFRGALTQLAKTQPDRHVDLTRLLDEGRFHDADAIEAMLEGGGR
jgi:hypothetical protein